MDDRLTQIRSLLPKHEARALLLTNYYAVRWACGFSGSNGALIVKPDAATLVTDSRYAEQADEEVQGAAISIMKGGMWTHLLAQKLLPDGRVLFQSDDLHVANWERLRELFPKVTWDGQAGLLEKLVAPKSPSEIASITSALRISEQAFQEILPLLKPGITELEIAAEITYQQLRAGAEKLPEGFSPIVLSGSRSARPHAPASAKKLATGDVVLLDFGCVIDGYNSDMSRTVAIGEPGPEVRKVYQVVLDAQQAALAVAKAGMPAHDLDAAARSVIAAAGYGAGFGYAVGHGVGLQIHEYPGVRPPNHELLPENAVITIEPGIHVPGQFGVRIEDMIVLRANGCENLSTLPKELLVV